MFGLSPTEILTQVSLYGSCGKLNPAMQSLAVLASFISIREQLAALDGVVDLVVDLVDGVAQLSSKK